MRRALSYCRRAGYCGRGTISNSGGWRQQSPAAALLTQCKAVLQRNWQGGYAIIGCAGRGLKTLFEKLGHEHSVLLTLQLLLYPPRCSTRQKKGHAGFNGVAKVQ